MSEGKTQDVRTSFSRRRENDTPKTDQEAYLVWDEGNHGMGDEYADEVIGADFARELESALAAVTAERDSLLKENEKYLCAMHDMSGEIEQLRFERDSEQRWAKEYHEQNEKLLKVLEAAKCYIFFADLHLWLIEEFDPVSAVESYFRAEDEIAEYQEIAYNDLKQAIENYENQKLRNK